MSKFKSILKKPQKIYPSEIVDLFVGPEPTIQEIQEAGHKLIAKCYYEYGITPSYEDIKLFSSDWGTVGIFVAVQIPKRENVNYEKEYEQYLLDVEKENKWRTELQAEKKKLREEYNKKLNELHSIKKRIDEKSI